MQPLLINFFFDPYLYAIHTAFLLHSHQDTIVPRIYIDEAESGTIPLFDFEIRLIFELLALN